LTNKQTTTINVSIGTAVVLGLTEAAMTVAPTTAYLMLGGRCSMACAFCAQARNSQAGALNLSRVTWPEFPQAETIDRLAQAVERGAIRRCCLQATAGQGYFEQTLAVVKAVKAATDVPLDVAILPPTLGHVAELIAAGVDHVGFGLDAASEAVFRRVKGSNWTRSLALIQESARHYPGRVAVHLIVGLGETEQQMVETVQRFHDWGVIVGLFAFTPVRGTEMENQPPPPLAVYRRMQVAHYLITHDLARAGDFAFSLSGRLNNFGSADLKSLLADGAAFQTSGCPDCNRPYYNERPAGAMYNYARPLSGDEIRQVMAMLNDSLGE